MTITISISDIILRPQQDVWAFLTDFDNAPKWMPGISKVIQLDEGDTGRGSQLRHELNGSSNELIVNYWDRGECFTLSLHKKSYHIDSSYVLETRDNNTQLTLILTVGASGLWRLFLPIIAWLNRRDAASRVVKLKQNLESNTSDQ